MPWARIRRPAFAAEHSGHHSGASSTTSRRPSSSDQSATVCSTRAPHAAHSCPAGRLPTKPSVVPQARSPGPRRLGHRRTGRPHSLGEASLQPQPATRRRSPRQRLASGRASGPRREPTGPLCARGRPIEVLRFETRHERLTDGGERDRPPAHVASGGRVTVRPWVGVGQGQFCHAAHSRIVNMLTVCRVMGHARCCPTAVSSRAASGRGRPRGPGPPAQSP